MQNETRDIFGKTELELELEMEQIKATEMQLTSILGSEALVKACMDPFDYALKLRTGEVIGFSKAKVMNRDWIHVSIKTDTVKNPFGVSVSRGMDIRISDIVWVMDAPNGS